MRPAGAVDPAEEPVDAPQNSALASWAILEQRPGTLSVGLLRGDRPYGRLVSYLVTAPCAGAVLQGSNTINAKDMHHARDDFRISSCPSGSLASAGHADAAFPFAGFFCVRPQLRGAAREDGHDPDTAKAPFFFTTCPTPALDYALHDPLPAPDRGSAPRIELVIAIGKGGPQHFAEEDVMGSTVWGASVGIRLTRPRCCRPRQRKRAPMDWGKPFDNSARLRA